MTAARARMACAVALTLTLPVQAQAQVPRQVGLNQNTYQLLELNAGAPVHVFTLPIGTSRLLTIDVTSNASAVDVEIVTPSGTLIDPALVERFAVAPGQVPPLGAVLFEEGFHVQTQVMSPGVGAWTVRVTLPAGAAATFVKISSFVTGGVIIGVTMSRPTYQANQTAVLALLAFREGAPVIGATATANIYVTGAEATPLVVALLDDGQNEDATAGDGVYSGGITGLAPAHYLVTASVQVDDYRATGTTNFDVTGNLARFTGTTSDVGVDTNADGLFEWIGVNVDVTVDTEGTYVVSASLRSPSNTRELSGGAEAALAAGPQSLQIRFAAADIRELLATNGPWEVRDVFLVPVSPGGIANTMRIDSIADLGLTRAYSLAQLQRPLSQIIAGMTERAIDTNANGLFDLLQTTFQVDTLRAGSYTWTGSLRSADGNPLSVSSGQGTLAIGVTTLGFTFDAKAIGASGVDGPYGLFDVAVYGPPGAAALLGEVGRTQPYTASQFEGSQVTMARLIEMVEAVPIFGRGGVPVTNDIRRSLLQQLAQAQRHASAGRIKPATGVLGAFVNEIEALADERIMPDDKTRLIDFTNRLLVRLQTP